MSDQADFAFLTNHARVLLCLARHPSSRARDVAVWLNITERAVQRIIADLASAGYVRVARKGRRNAYEVRAELPLRHPAEGARTVRTLLRLGMADTLPPLPKAEVRFIVPREDSFLD